MIVGFSRAFRLFGCNSFNYLGGFCSVIGPRVCGRLATICLIVRHWDRQDEVRARRGTAEPGAFCTKSG